MNRGVEMCSTALPSNLLKMAGNFTSSKYSKNSGNTPPPPGGGEGGIMFFFCSGCCERAGRYG
jgi:hypothetical protein